MSGGDEFIRIHGNVSYVNTWLKLMVVVLLVVCLVLGATMLVIYLDSRNEHIIPIVINEATGDAIAVDFRTIDASGESRSAVEVRKFCEDFIREAYSFNRFTVKTNLESLAKWTTPEALRQVREVLNLAHRAELTGRSAQGLSEITSFMITESNPNLKINVYFNTSVMSQRDEIIEESNHLGVFTIRPIKRSTRNPHGLIIIDYRQSQFKNQQTGG